MKIGHQVCQGSTKNPMKLLWYVRKLSGSRKQRVSHGPARPAKQKGPRNESIVSVPQMLEEERPTETRASSTLTLSWEQQGWRALGNTLWKFSSSPGV